MPYYHVTNSLLNLVKPTDYPAFKLKRFGKPVGLWYAHDTTWIDREATKGKPKYAYKYQFPLEGKFVDDISKPDITKIFRLTSSNIGQFEESFKAYLSETLKTKQAKLYVIALNSVYTDLRTDEEKVAPMDYKKYDQLLLKTAKDFIKGNATHPKISVALRLIEYGDYLENRMRPVWGGIDYDESLFTDDLKKQYPFIPYVEIPSGCLWHPKEVMPEYVPTPIAGGKRTRRNKFRKSTRRRKQ